MDELPEIIESTNEVLNLDVLLPVIFETIKNIENLLVVVLVVVSIRFILSYVTSRERRL